MIDENVVLLTLKCNKDQYPRILAKLYPHVLRKILEKWDAPDFEAYMEDLLETSGNSGGRTARDGFPMDAWQELYKLAELHRSIPR